MLSTNKERAIAALVMQGPQHRAALARSLSVSRTTVTNLVQDLIAEGYMADDGESPLKSTVKLTEKVGVLVSVVFWIDRTLISIASVDGRLLNSREIAENPHESGKVRLSHVEAPLSVMRAQLGDPTVRAGHVAVNTQINVRTGEVVGSAASSMWKGTNPLKAMGALLDAPICVENTARLAAFVEYERMGEPASSMAYVHLSHGITMGYVLDGALVRGGHGGAGELGHISIDPMGIPCECSNRGCLQQYVSTPAILARLRPILGEKAGVSDFVDAVNNGDHACVSLVEEIGEQLGVAMVTVTNLLDPEEIILGGELAKVGAHLLEPLRRVVRRRGLPLSAHNVRFSCAGEPASAQEMAAAAFRVIVHDEEIVELIVRSIA